MSQDQKFSDEFLNAFVDDQLALEEKGRAYSSINSDEGLNRRVCELRKMRDLVQLAYKQPPAVTPAGPRDRLGARLRASVAAGLILSTGVALGWLMQPPFAPGHAPLASAPSHPTDVAAPAPLAMAATPAPTAATANEIKVLFHLNSDSPVRVQGVLDEAEALLKFYQSAGQIARVQIIVNGEGLNLLRTDKSPDPERVSAMQKTYDNLSFAACQNTIDRLKREQGITAQLLPGAIVVDSGVAQIILRQQQGWIYIQV
jgi:intracellular sulfur oxidation DsrE/DsrF family protein